MATTLTVYLKADVGWAMPTKTSFSNIPTTDTENTKGREERECRVVIAHQKRFKVLLDSPERNWVSILILTSYQDFA